MGGVIANNATGAHSILYGMTADHLLSADTLLPDGSRATFGSLALGGWRRTRDRYSEVVDCARFIRERYSQAIRDHYPRSWRNSAGYRLNYLLPWSATQPAQWEAASYPDVAPGTLNMAALLAGSEGTLAVIQQATVRLVPKPAHTVLGILAYDSVAEACDAVPALLQHGPSAVELIPRMILQLAHGVPGYALQMDWLVGDPAALLVVEFSGQRQAELVERARRLEKDVTLVVSPEQQAQVWNIRRVGLGIMDSRPWSVAPDRLR